jgi:hypothetical protein
LSAHVGLRLGRIELPVASDTDVTDTFAGEEAPVHVNVVSDSGEVSIYADALQLPVLLAVKVRPFNDALAMLNAYALGTSCTIRHATHTREDLKVSIV